MSPNKPLLTFVAAVALFSTAGPAAAQTASSDQAQVTLQSADIQPQGRITFSGQGFTAGEQTAVTVEDDQGNVQAHLDAAQVQPDGEISAATAQLPDGLALGTHTLHVQGSSSARQANAQFRVAWEPPTVQLDTYTGKPTHTFGFSGSGFVPGEQVDVYLGSQSTAPIIGTVVADNRGDLSARDLTIPMMTAGDYTLTLVGRSSHTPASVGFNIQGFHPWVVLDNYYVAPHGSVGVSGEDFVPGETVQVYLNTRVSQPVAQVTAGSDGRFAVKNAVSLPDLTGNNELIFVGQQSQTEETATFATASPTPTTN